MVAGPIADTLGVRAWYIISGAMCVLMGLIGFSAPAILRIEDRNMVAESGESERSLPIVQRAAGGVE